MPNKLKIVSYNIRKAWGTDWRYDPERIIQILAQLQADIVILQEADKRLPPRPPALDLEAVKARLSLDHIDFDDKTPSIGWHGNAMFYSSKLKLQDFQGFDLPGLEPRGGIEARFLTNQGKILTLIGVHMGLLRSSRIEQLDFLSQRYSHREEAVLIAGDFNEWSRSSGFEAMRDEFSHIIPGASFHAMQPVAALDRFFHNPNVHCHAAGVFNEGLAKMGSDHLPIWAEIEV